MKDFKQKHKIKRAQEMFFSIPVLFVLIIFVVLMTVAVWNIYKKARNTQINLNKITTVHKDLQDRELELISNVDGLETEFGVEAEIRDKYGLVREGEEVIVIIDDNKKQDVLNDENKSWWQKIKNLF